MRRVTLLISLLLLGFCTHVTAQDKVVVIPLGSGVKVGGTDTQFQYNNNGTLSGAEVYYDAINGRVGIGTTTPSAQLSISGEDTRVIFATSAYGDQQVDSSPMFIGRKARGSFLIPTAVNQGDVLTYFGGKGYDGVNWDFFSTAGIAFAATENHDALSKGTSIKFFTTLNGSASKLPRMAISNNGNVGIGTMNPLSKLAVSGLPTTPPGTNAGVVCVTVDGNFWLDDDGIIDCQ